MMSCRRQSLLCRLLLLLLALVVPCATSFQPLFQRGRRITRLGAAAASDDEEEDWRDFRAKLVMQFQKEQQETEEEEITQQPQQASTTTLDDDATTTTDGGWAYESGTTIETGSVILSRTEQDFGHGIRQQYFHKCVILVLEHQEHVFTKGIILNRPTDLILGNEDFVYQDGTGVVAAESSSNNDDEKWKIWFGGDVCGMTSPVPEWTCLHSLHNNSHALKVSQRVMKKMHYTTLQHAHDLCQQGHAKPSDFWLFAGYCGWAPGQLRDELDRESWFMAATDPQTLLLELQRQDIGTPDPRDAGLETWGLLMKRIGKGKYVKSTLDLVANDDFEDLMLREWARERLVFRAQRDETGVLLMNAFDTAMKRAQTQAKANMKFDDDTVEQAAEIAPGTLLSASRTSLLSNRPPFLLDQQEFHNGLVLIVEENADATVGVLLTLPTPNAVQIVQTDPDKPNAGSKYLLPLRYGGRYGVRGQADKPVFWLHASPELRNLEIGKPLSPTTARGIYACTQADVQRAVDASVNPRNTFLVVSGFCVWPKQSGMTPEGQAVVTLQDELQEEKFTIVPPEQVDAVWRILTRQTVLSEETASANLQVASQGWSEAQQQHPPDEDGQDNLVYRSQTNVHLLADRAWKSWVATFLLGNPKLEL